MPDYAPASYVGSVVKPQEPDMKGIQVTPDERVWFYQNRKSVLVFPESIAPEVKIGEELYLKEPWFPMFCEHHESLCSHRMLWDGCIIYPQPIYTNTTANTCTYVMPCTAEVHQLAFNLLDTCTEHVARLFMTVKSVTHLDSVDEISIQDAHDFGQPVCMHNCTHIGTDQCYGCVSLRERAKNWFASTWGSLYQTAGPIVVIRVEPHLKDQS